MNGTRIDLEISSKTLNQFRLKVPSGSCSFGSPKNMKIINLKKNRSALMTSTSKQKTHRDFQRSGLHVFHRPLFPEVIQSFGGVWKINLFVLVNENLSYVTFLSECPARWTRSKWMRRRRRRSQEGSSRFPNCAVLAKTQRRRRRRVPPHLSLTTPFLATAH